MDTDDRDELRRRSATARRLAAALAGFEPPTGVDDPRAESDRIRLFVNAPGGTPLPPFAGWWIDGTLGGRTSAEVAAVYAAEGLQVDAAAGPPDGLSCELEFLAFLLRHQLAARETGRTGLESPCRERERDFLERFLLPWIPELVRRGRIAAAGTVWRDVLEEIGALVAAEARRVGCAP